MKLRNFPAVLLVSMLFFSLTLTQAEADYKTKLTLTIAAASPTYDEAYILTVPADFTITKSGWNSVGNITVTHDSSYSTTFNPAKKVVITATSDNSFALKSENNDTISYTLKTAEADTSATTVFEFSADDINAENGTSKEIGISLTYDSSTPSGNYEDYITYTAQVTASYSVGDKVTFGKYSNHELGWTVMSVSDTQALLLCDNAVKKMAWDSTETSTTWESSSLYSWLNGEFKSSFEASDARTAKISVVTLLSETEMSLPFTNTSKSCTMFGGEDTVIWWLSTPVTEGNRAEYVTLTNGLNDKVVSESAGVRPALLINF
ncbi:MAG: hypothetical protein IJG39_04595 [Synergistaceae bacterium]|nr:hypothetical protein [Synergistaceae bacterium]